MGKERGYIRLSNKRDCIYADKKGRVFEHRYVWWKTYGKNNLILSNEVLHHKNKKRDDNKIENLEKELRSEHCRKHIQRLTPEERKEHRREYERRYSKKLNLWKRQNRILNREKVLKKERTYREKNKDKIKKQKQEYRKKNREKCNQQSNRWYHKNKEKLKYKMYYVK